MIDFSFYYKIIDNKLFDNYILYEVFDMALMLSNWNYKLSHTWYRNHIVPLMQNPS